MRVKYRILLYQRELNPLLLAFLKTQGYTIIETSDATVSDLIIEGKYDLAILEEPKEGPTFKYVQLLRKYFEKKPVLFVSSLFDMGTVLEGFNGGASDYIEKPCNYQELAARIKAHLRYVTIKSGRTIFKFGNFTFDSVKKTLAIYDPVSGTDKDIPIKAAEARILEALCSYNGELCPRKAILEGIWGEINYFNSRSLDVALVYIRKFLKLDPRVQLISYRKQGYRLFVEDSNAETEIVEIKKGAK